MHRKSSGKSSSKLPTYIFLGIHYLSSLPISRPLDLTAIMELDDFQSKTGAFLSWLADSGIRMSPKIELKDLRSASRGRGVGKSSLSV